MFEEFDKFLEEFEKIVGKFDSNIRVILLLFYAKGKADQKNKEKKLI